VAVLLDTHAFLWWCEDAQELSAKARKAIAGADCFVSLATFWEIAIKCSLEKLRLPGAAERYLAEQMSLNGFEILEISFRHTMSVISLPWHHHDPFDRLLAAQALEQGIPIVSRDDVFTDYGVDRLW
jgi:PIN domain nuclease of toxin-antitoxin system